MKFADVLRKLRKERGMNQEQFAEFCGLSRPSISRYEAGKKISREAALKIADCCGIDINQIFETDAMEPESLQESEFTELYNQLSDADKEMLVRQMKFLLSEDEKNRKSE